MKFISEDKRNLFGLKMWRIQDKMKKKLSYILIWLLPFALFCVCGYDFIVSAWIYVSTADKMLRLEGYAYLFSGLIHAVILIVSSAIAIALTVYFYRKKNKGKM